MVVVSHSPLEPQKSLISLIFSADWLRQSPTAAKPLRLGGTRPTKLRSRPTVDEALV